MWIHQAHQLQRMFARQFAVTRFALVVRPATMVIASMATAVLPRALWNLALPASIRRARCPTPVSPRAATESALAASNAMTKTPSPPTAVRCVRSTRVSAASTLRYRQLRPMFACRAAAMEFEVAAKAATTLILSMATAAPRRVESKLALYAWMSRCHGLRRMFVFQPVVMASALVTKVATIATVVPATAVMQHAESNRAFNVMTQ